MTTSERLRVGFIGATGRWGPSAHLPALQRLPETEVYAVCTAHDETAKAAAQKYGVERAYSDDKAMNANPGVEATAVIVRVPKHYVLAKNALGLIDFLKHAFSARELAVITNPDGALLHAAVTVGDAVLELGESLPQPAQFYLYVPDADAVYEQAIAAGATSLYPPAVQPYGDRCGGVRDSWGNTWHIATDLTTR